ncbi:MAG: hypothetical protein AABW90_00275 [Nanoarchaeota archaeon]
MLFHLKEPDYKIEAPNDIITRFYGRNQQQILTALDYYTERGRKDGVDMKDPNLIWWLKRKFSKEDMEQTEKGEFNFFSGLICITEENKDKSFFDEIKVTNDFSVYISNENIGNFVLWKTNMMQKERGGLYKLQNPIEMFMNISFVPEDIAKAIMNCDLTPYREIIEKDMAKRADLSKHPNIKVNGLQNYLRRMSP